MSADLRVDSVTKRFGGVTAVDDVSLEAGLGEFVVLLGPSGCGKSTLLRMVAGLEQPDQGRIELAGRDITRLEPRERDVAMVFQSYALYPHMTVAENIAYPLRIRKWKPHDTAVEVDRVARKLGLSELLPRRPRALSGGQRQRVALARAIVRRPKAFLMDEPLSNLDARLRVGMRAELKHLQREISTVTLYVTHDQSEAMTLAHRIAVMNQGRVEQYDTPANVYDCPANLFVASFVGSPSMNLLDGEIESGAFRNTALTFALTAAELALIEGRRRITAGFRPENVEVALEYQPGFQASRLWVSEAMGNETFLVLDARSARITVRVDSGWSAPDGTPVWFRPRPGKVHLFDTESTKAFRS